MEYLLNCKVLFDHLDGKEKNLDATKEPQWKKLNKNQSDPAMNRSECLLSCYIRDRCIYILDKVREHVSGQDLSEYSPVDEVIDKLKLKSEASEHTGEFQSLVNQQFAMELQLRDGE